MLWATTPRRTAFAAARAVAAERLDLAARSGDHHQLLEQVQHLLAPAHEVPRGQLRAALGRRHQRLVEPVAARPAVQRPDQARARARGSGPARAPPRPRRRAPRCAPWRRARPAPPASASDRPRVRRGGARTPAPTRPRPARPHRAPPRRPPAGTLRSPGRTRTRSAPAAVPVASSRPRRGNRAGRATGRSGRSAARASRSVPRCGGADPRCRARGVRGARPSACADRGRGSRGTGAPAAEPAGPAPASSSPAEPDDLRRGRAGGGRSSACRLEARSRRTCGER